MIKISNKKCLAITKSMIYKISLQICLNLTKNKEPQNLGKRKLLRKRKYLKTKINNNKKTKPTTINPMSPWSVICHYYQYNKAPGTHNIYVKTFGCSHNISDSEFMIGQLVEYGYNMVDNPEDADLVLINSCTVVNPSQTAFINMVCKAKKIKKPIVVAGCVPQG